MGSPERSDDASPPDDRHGRGDMTAFAHPRELVDAFASALNAKNADELGRLFTEDAEFVNILGMRMRRRAGIVDGHAWAFAGPLRGRHVRFDQVDELKVTDDVTVLHGHCMREREPDPRGRTSRRRLGVGLRDPPRSTGLADRRRHQRHRGRTPWPVTVAPPTGARSDRRDLYPPTRL